MLQVHCEGGLLLMPATITEWFSSPYADATLVPLCAVTLSGERFNSCMDTSGFVVSSCMSTIEAASRIDGFCGMTLRSIIMVSPATTPWYSWIMLMYLRMMLVIWGRQINCNTPLILETHYQLGNLLAIYLQHSERKYESY